MVNYDIENEYEEEDFSCEYDIDDIMGCDGPLPPWADDDYFDPDLWYGDDD